MLQSLKFALYIGEVELLERFIWRHNILTEEVQGGKYCTISLHNLIHMVDDIKRFSSPDNYWCYTFERAVHNYVEKSSNKKHLELTFTRSECRREVLKFLSTTEVACCGHNGDCFSKVYSYMASFVPICIIYACKSITHMHAHTVHTSTYTHGYVYEI